MNMNDAIKRQHEITHRLKAEIDEGLMADTNSDEINAITREYVNRFIDASTRAEGSFDAYEHVKANAAFAAPETIELAMNQMKNAYIILSAIVLEGREEITRVLKDAATKTPDQIDLLANCIMAEVPGEPSQSEGAGETAIRLIKQYRALLDAVNAYRAARTVELPDQNSRTSAMYDAYVAMLAAADQCR